VGLLCSLRLDTPSAEGAAGQHQASRLQLLLALALWKVASFLDLLSVELSLRTECKLRLKRDEQGDVVAIEAKCEGGPTAEVGDFPFPSIAKETFTDIKNDKGDEPGLISNAHLPANRSPLTLQFA